MIDKDVDKWYHWQVSTNSALSCNKNHASWKRNTYSSCTVETVAADNLATQGARASVAMVLTCFFEIFMPLLGIRKISGRKATSSSAFPKRVCGHVLWINCSNITEYILIFCWFLLFHILMPYNKILYFRLPYFFVSNSAFIFYMIIQ